MLQQIDKKKIFVYLFFLFTLSTLNNLSLNKSELFKLRINQINVSGLSNEGNNKIAKNLNKLIFQNIFFLDKEYIIKILAKKNLIHSYEIKKIYPSSIAVIIKETKFLAITNYNKKNYFIGSNSKLIESNSINKNLPYVFGKTDFKDFVNFVKIIENSNFNFKEISEIFFFQSGRWDIKIKNGVLFKLPKIKLTESLNLAYQIMNKDNFKNIKIVDLRILNHVILTNE